MDTKNICRHIAIIMDGNGRWAKKRGMPRTFGHKKGAENVVKITRAMKESGVKYLTLYAFSTENWQRSKDEVDALMQLLNEYLDKELKEIMDNNVRIVFIGERYMLSDSIQAKMTFLEKESEKNTDLTLCIALSYGSRQEILFAVKKNRRKSKRREHGHQPNYTRCLFRRIIYKRNSGSGCFNQNQRRAENQQLSALAISIYRVVFYKHFMA